MQKSFFVLIFGLLGCYHNTIDGASMELRLPTVVQPITNIVNRITNRTFGIVRGGLNLFSNTIDRIVNSFGRVEDRLRELFEVLREQILRGIPELSIPILDPLHINRIVFDIVHEAARLKGKAEDVTVKHISDFTLEQVKFTDLGDAKFRLDLNLTFPSIQIDGMYEVDGLIGDMFMVFGNGKFWLNLINFKLAIKAIIKFDYPLKLTRLFIDVKLDKLDNHFDNMMKDPEVGELFNKAISDIAPEALDILWPDIKQPIEQQVTVYVNQILENGTVANLARRLFGV